MVLEGHADPNSDQDWAEGPPFQYLLSSKEFESGEKKTNLLRMVQGLLTTNLEYISQMKSDLYKTFSNC